jgi:hypothetical protein
MIMAWSTNQRPRQEIEYIVKNEAHKATSLIGGGLVGLVHHGPWLTYSLIHIPYGIVD